MKRVTNNFNPFARSQNLFSDLRVFLKSLRNRTAVNQWWKKSGKRRCFLITTTCRLIFSILMNECVVIDRKKADGLYRVQRRRGDRWSTHTLDSNYVFIWLKWSKSIQLMERTMINCLLIAIFVGTWMARLGVWMTPWKMNNLEDFVIRFSRRRNFVNHSIRYTLYLWNGVKWEMIKPGKMFN